MTGEENRPRVNKTKTGLLFVAVTLISMASHAMVSGDIYVGLIQIGIGLLLIVMYEVAQALQIKLSEEEVSMIREVIMQQREEWKR